MRISYCKINTNKAGEVMKIYLIDPKKKWCKANLHGHSNYSDGYFSPKELKELYKKHGYEIVAFTDHEVIFDSSYLTDDNFVAITSTEYSINEDYDANKTVSFNGKNITIPRYAKTIHLCLYAKDPHNTFHVATNYERLEKKQIDLYKPKKIQCDGYNRVYTQESIQETIDRANKAGFLVQFNHPNWSLNDRDDFINLKGLWALEVLNYMTELETGAENCIIYYDDMIRNGHTLYCTMGDDNHNPGGSEFGSFGGFTYIGVNKLNYSEVISAMENGDLYCSSGPVIKSLYIDTDDDKIYVECSEATNIIFVSANRRFRNYHGENLTKADFKIFGGEIYFRLTIRDKNNNVAHTHVYFLKDYGYE